jgi:hypothetical protein
MGKLIFLIFEHLSGSNATTLCGIIKPGHTLFRMTVTTHLWVWINASTMNPMKTMPAHVITFATTSIGWIAGKTTRITFPMIIKVIAHPTYPAVRHLNQQGAVSRPYHVPSLSFIFIKNKRGDLVD